METILVNLCLKFLCSLSAKKVELCFVKTCHKRQCHISQHCEEFALVSAVVFCFDFFHCALEVKGVLFTKDDIVASSEKFHQLEVLVNHADAVVEGIKR